MRCPNIRANGSGTALDPDLRAAGPSALNRTEEQTMTTRRFFLIATGALTAAAATGRVAYAQSARLAEADPQAVALGYRHDTGKVDKAKYPKHAATQNCANCALYQGKAGEKWGGCPIFPGKQVSANGWCSAWGKKA
jgi:hypothetical protein